MKAKDEEIRRLKQLVLSAQMEGMEALKSTTLQLASQHQQEMLELVRKTSEAMDRQESLLNAALVKARELKMQNVQLQRALD
eukprot:10979798-Karenia_brevis.AAC.1